MDDELIGFASGIIHHHPDKSAQLFISEVGVNAPFRKRGIGAALVNALKAGYDTVWLATEEDNAAARGLYLKTGGAETKGVVVYDWGGVMDAD